MLETRIHKTREGWGEWGTLKKHSNNTDSVNVVTYKFSVYVAESKNQCGNLIISVWSEGKRILEYNTADTAVQCKEFDNV